MEASEPRENVAPKPAESSAAWIGFWIAAGLAATWPFWGAYLLFYMVGAFDPLIMLAFSIPCALLILSERERRGTGVTPRTLTCLAVFLGVLALFLFRPVLGLGDSSDVSVIVSVVDQETGQPVDGARVKILGDRDEINGGVTDERGQARFGFHWEIDTSFSWLVTYRSVKPDPVAVEAVAPGYAPAEQALAREGGVRWHLIGGNFRRIPQEFTINVKLELEKWEEDPQTTGEPPDAEVATIEAGGPP